MRLWRIKVPSLAWLLSVHAKLFLLLGLVTSILTVAVAYSITRNSKRELETYSRKLVIEATGTVRTDILERDPTFKDPDKLDQLLESIAGPDRSIFQIDVFKRIGKGTEVELVRSSGVEADVDWGPEIGSYMSLPGPQAELVELEKGGRAWKVYLPIRTHKSGQPPIGLIRAYCALERWDDVWDSNYKRTLGTLPGVLLGEFILLWLILRMLISDPIESIVLAMQRLERGETEARAPVRRGDELGLISARFNDMAAQLQRASDERESLIHEIRGLNTNLQDRIDAALSELQAKNHELAAMVERNALLREELGAQERLAVAGQLTATFAHEVGTPLNLVTGHLQLLDAQADLPDKTPHHSGPDPAGGGHRTAPAGPDPAPPAGPGTPALRKPAGGPAAALVPHLGGPQRGRAGGGSKPLPAGRGSQADGAALPQPHEQCHGRHAQWRYRADRHPPRGGEHPGRPLVGGPLPGFWPGHPR